MDELKVPLSKPCEVSEGVSVWEWSGTALDEGAEASKWFSDYLGKPSRLVRFNEDIWKVIKIDNLTFRGVKLCSRCKVPTINQENAIASAEPMALLKFRSDKVLRSARKQQGKVYFRIWTKYGLPGLPYRRMEG